MKKSLFRMILILAFCLIPASVCALDTEYWDGRMPVFSEAVTADAGTFGLAEDTLLPVMSAPFEEAWRGAKGKASVSLREPFLLLGTLQNQTWALISYSVSKNAGRIGWVQIDPDRCALTDSYDLTVERRLCRVLREAPATDDPLGSNRVIRTLAPGEEVIGILVCGSQICVETLVEGKPAWLFVSGDALEEIPLISVEGTAVRVDDRVTILGSCSYVPPSSGNQSDYEWSLKTVIRPGDVQAPGLDFSEEGPYGQAPEGGWQLLLPSSLRMLGSGAVMYASLEELRLPASLEYADPEALYGCSIRRLLLPAEYRCNLPYQYWIGAYEAEEGGSRYGSADGVLFSADGKTLIRYPGSKAAEHYTVPAGVEVIASHAFSSDSMDIPLKSISLPIGLRRIEDYAFEGCGRLQSLTVPLTVTEIGERAFSCCVSLERLSLPPGFSASFSADDYAQQADFTWYSGDNGETLSAPDPDEHDMEDLFRHYSVWIDNPAGEGNEKLYADEALTRVLQELPAGTCCSVADVRNGIAYVVLGYGKSQVKGYIPLDRLLTCQDGPTLFYEDGITERSTGRRWDFWSCSRQGRSVTVWEDGNVGEVFSTEELILTYEGSGNGRKLALLTAEAGEAIRFFDRPEGTETAHTYDGVQAVVLEQREGWALVQTVVLTGWIREEYLWAAEPAGAGRT